MLIKLDSININVDVLMDKFKLLNENENNKSTIVIKHRKVSNFNNQENKYSQTKSKIRTEIEIDDLLSMLKENLIVRNKVDLKIVNERHFVIGRRRPRVIVEYVDAFMIHKSKQKPVFFTTVNN